VQKGIIGYCVPLTCRPGDRVDFKVSCERPHVYDVDVVRLICADGWPDGAGFEEHVATPALARDLLGRRQHTSIGSYAVAEHSALTSTSKQFTLSAIVRPTALGPARQAIAGTWREDCRAGFLLGLTAEGYPGLWLGDGAGQCLLVCGDQPVTLDRWGLIATAVDVERGEARVWYLPLGSSIEIGFRRASRGFASIAFVPSVAPGHSFYFAAEIDQHGHPTSNFNGRIEAPRLLSRAWSEEQSTLLMNREVPQDLESDVVAWWDFSLGIETRLLHDRSATAAHARTQNLPNRAVPGHCWTGEAHDWRAAPEQYAAVHFHADDLYDVGWQTDFSWQVPEDLPSGIYAARLTAGADLEYIPFFVLAPRGRPGARVAFLAATATYLAYANIRTLLERDPPFGTRTPNEAALAAHLEFGHSTYDRHRDGSGVHYSSPLRPILNLKPRSYRWGFCADTNIVAWLHRTGHLHDVITDDALHTEGMGLLRAYDVVVTGTHPEYYSTPMLNALSNYTNSGGRLMYMGGNGFYWRIAYSSEWPGAIEVRRAEGGTRPWIAEAGEYRHAFTGEMGGLWRRLGRPPNLLVGIGFSGQGFPNSTYYRRTEASHDPRVAFIFAGVNEDIIGDFGANGGGAAGEELDRYDAHLGSPLHALVVATSEAIPKNVLRTIEEVTTINSLFQGHELRQDPNVRSDVVFFECPGGGAVFSTGSIAWAGSLAHNGYDNSIARICNNVLRQFLSAAIEVGSSPGKSTSVRLQPQR
jgi:N,N-dimethylformamidase